LLKPIVLVFMKLNYGIKRVWHVPHSALTPGLRDTSPLIDILYIRMLNFLYKCRKSESQLIIFTVRYGIPLSPLDYVKGRNVRNVLNCALRYHISLHSIGLFSGTVLNARTHIFYRKHRKSSRNFSSIVNK